MSRETSKKWNLSVKQKRELIRLSEEEGKSSRQLAKFTEQKFGRKIENIEEERGHQKSKPTGN